MESIVDTFVNGIKNMYKNKIILLPFLLFTVISIVFSLIWTAIPLMEIEIDPLVLNIGAAISSVILFILTAYVSVGMIGMSKEAISTGKTKFKDLFTYGNKFTIRFIFATIILLILQLVTIVFWLPVIYLFMNSGYTVDLFLDLLMNNFDALVPFLKTLFVPALFCLLPTLIYLFAIWVLFYFVTYAIVVDDLPVIASFKKSYAIARQHFWKVVLFIIMVYAVTAGVIVITYTIFCFVLLFVVLFTAIFTVASPTLSTVGILIMLIIMLVMSIFLLVVLVFVSVAEIVWTTRFYMSVNDHELHTKEKENLLE